MTASHVIFLTQSEALSSILATTLQCKFFTTHQALTSQDAIGLLRLHPIEHVVCDFSINDQNVSEIIPALRRAVPYRKFNTLVLTANVDNDVQQICRATAIDEVIVKPMSPRFIAERLAARTVVRMDKNTYQTPASEMGENVVQLFGQKPSPELPVN